MIIPKANDVYNYFFSKVGDVLHKYRVSINKHGSNNNKLQKGKWNCR